MLLLLLTMAQMAQGKSATVNGGERTIRKMQDFQDGQRCQEVTMTDCDTFLDELEGRGWEEGSCADVFAGSFHYYCDSLNYDGNELCWDANGIIDQKYTIKNFVTKVDMCPAESKPRTIRTVDAEDNEKVCFQITMTDCDYFLAEMLVQGGWEEGSCDDVMETDAFHCKPVRSDEKTSCSSTDPTDAQYYTIESLATNEKLCSVETEEGMMGKKQSESSVFMSQVPEEASTSPVTLGFAAIGLGALLFGSYKHYWGKTEEYTRLEMA